MSYRLAAPSEPLPSSALSGESASSLTVPAGRLRRATVVEFLAVGGATLFLLPLFWLLGRTSFADEAEYQTSFLAFYAAYVVNDPHFAVTYVLFYRGVKERALSRSVSVLQRVRYWIAGLVVPMGLIAWGGWALVSSSAVQLGLIFQLMYFLVSWHYAKQAFGILMTLCVRRGVRFSSVERKLLLAHCLSAWFFARAQPRELGRDYLEQGVLFHSLAHPAWFLPVSAGVLALTTVGVLAALVVFVRRERRFPPLTPLTAFLVSIWIWTIFTDLSPTMIYVIPGLHSLQYLYFVWLQRRNEGRVLEGEPYLGRPASVHVGVLAVTALALGWFLFHGLPETLDELFASRDPQVFGAIGATPFMAVIFAFINIHHYFMDAVIWRREVPETRYLVG